MACLDVESAQPGHAERRPADHGGAERVHRGAQPDPAADPDGDLVGRRRRGEKGRAVGADVLGRREDGREGVGAGMVAAERVSLVQLEPDGGGAVDEGGRPGAGSDAGREDGGRSGATDRRRGRGEVPNLRLDAGGDDGCHGVGHQGDRVVDVVVGQDVRAQAPLDQPLESPLVPGVPVTHASSPPRTRSMRPETSRRAGQGENGARDRCGGVGVQHPGGVEPRTSWRARRWTADVAGPPRLASTRTSCRAPSAMLDAQHRGELVREDLVAARRRRRSGPWRPARAGVVGGGLVGEVLVDRRPARRRRAARPPRCRDR